MKRDDQKTAEGILYTDEYHLTMAQLYYRVGLHERYAQFDHFFRSYPDYGEHQAGYCINAGLEWLLDWMREARFRDEDIDYLRKQTRQTGDRLFADDFLDWLRTNGTFDSLTLHAIPEGRVIHPNVCQYLPGQLQERFYPNLNRRPRPSLRAGSRTHHL